MSQIIQIAQVEKKLITLRDQRVLLDSDVAALYAVKTKEINQAIKNNPAKFPEGYTFHLSRDEWQNLKSQFQQKTLMQKSGEIMADILGEGIKTTDTETSMELNLAILKFKHTITRLRPSPGAPAGSTGGHARRWAAQCAASACSPACLRSHSRRSAKYLSPAALKYATTSASVIPAISRPTASFHLRASRTPLNFSLVSVSISEVEYPEVHQPPQFACRVALPQHFFLKVATDYAGVQIKRWNGHTPDPAPLSPKVKPPFLRSKKLQTNPQTTKPFSRKEPQNPQKIPKTILSTDCTDSHR